MSNLSMDKVKNVEQTKAAQLSPIEQKRMKIKTLVSNLGKDIANALPKHMSVERFSRIMMTAINQTPKLLECNHASIVGAVLQCAQYGLEPNALGQCYLIPYKDQCQFQIGYKGLLDLARRSGQIQSVSACAVYKTDKLTIEKGLEEKLEHIPDLDADRNDPNDIVVVYAVAKFKDGGHHFEFMTKKQVDAVRDQYSKAKNSGPWLTDYESMALKTVIKRAVKYWPLSMEIIDIINQDETIKTEIHADMKEPQPMENVNIYEEKKQEVEDAQVVEEVQIEEENDEIEFPHVSSASNLISEKQRKRLYALMKEAGRSNDEVKEYLLKEWNIESSNDIQIDWYEVICNWIQKKD